jgi:glutamyl-tRNA synthetase
VARKTGATYVLRIEDTDMERSTAASEKSILDDLRWLGISWHEGPDCGGNHGPYRQSERFDIYAEYTNRLLAEGKAYHCFCTSEELDAMREQAQQDGRPFAYPEKCRHLDEAAKQKLLAEGRKPTVRFHVPANEEIAFEDQIRGPISFNGSNIGGDFIIVRSDGVPVYNYIVVIDDCLMQVSHVIRGEDHLPNTPKQIAIARALGIESPLFAHLPLVLGDDRKKLSKRHGITSVELFRDQGYLPEALVNYIAMLGWAAEDGSEIMSQDEIVERIDLSALGKSAAVFVFQKLGWINSK